MKDCWRRDSYVDPLTELVRHNDADGTAALGICGPFARLDRFKDVVITHQQAGAVSERPDKHDAVVAILQRTLAGKNGVRH